MRFKQVRRKATAIALSAAMAFSFNVATPTSVKAADTSKLSSRVTTIFDMQNAKFNGEVNLDFAKEKPYEWIRFDHPVEEVVGPIYSSLEAPEEDELIEQAGAIINQFMDAKFGTLSQYDSEKEFVEGSSAYLNYLAKIGIGKVVTNKENNKLHDYYGPEQMKAVISFDGEFKNKYNFNLNLYLKLFESEKQKVAFVSVVDGKIILSIDDYYKALGYYLDEKPRVVKARFNDDSMSNPMTQIAMQKETDIIEFIRTLLATYMTHMSETSEEYARFEMINSIFEKIEKDAKAEGSEPIGKAAIDAVEKLVSLVSGVADSTYASASTSNSGKNSFKMDKTNFKNILMNWYSNLGNSGEKIKAGLKDIVAPILEEKYKKDVNDGIVNYVDGIVKNANTTYAELTKNGDGFKLSSDDDVLVINSSLTGDKGARDYEIDGKFYYGRYRETMRLPLIPQYYPYASRSQKLTATFKFSMKEPDAGKVKPAPEKMGPKVGSTIKDKNCSYKVITQGSDKKVGEVEVKKANKKNVKKVVIKGAVKINGVKYKVTSIGAKAFKGNKKLTKVTIGKNVKRIKSNAFAGCSALTTVVSKSKVLSRIDKGAFVKDTKLTSVNFKLSTKLNKIAKGAFKGVKKSCKISVNKKLKKKLVKKLKKAGCKATVK